MFSLFYFFPSISGEEKVLHFVTGIGFFVTGEKILKFSSGIRAVVDFSKIIRRPLHGFIYEHSCPAELYMTLTPPFPQFSFLLFLIDDINSCHKLLVINHSPYSDRFNCFILNKKY